MSDNRMVGFLSMPLDLREHKHFTGRPHQLSNVCGPSCVRVVTPQRGRFRGNELIRVCLVATDDADQGFEFWLVAIATQTAVL